MTDTPRDPEEQQLDAEEEEFSNAHPLASPNELAGDAQSGLDLEFAAREIADGEGAAAGAELEDDTLPLDGN
jgi:hypothetical protein